MNNKLVYVKEISSLIRFVCKGPLCSYTHRHKQLFFRSAQALFTSILKYCLFFTIYKSSQHFYSSSEKMAVSRTNWILNKGKLLATTFGNYYPYPIVNLVMRTGESPLWYPCQDHKLVAMPVYVRRSR